MPERDTEFTMQLMKAVGRLEATQEQFVAEYRDGKKAAQEHATKMVILVDGKVDREEIGPLLVVNSMLKSWLGITILFGILISLGYMAIGERLEKFIEAKTKLQQIVEPPLKQKKGAAR